MEGYSMSEDERGEGQRTLSVALDAARYASRDEAAFLAWRAHTPVYHGCPILEDVSIDGFAFGKITDFEAEPTVFGDAFVVAPDDSRAGLIWAVSQKPYFAQAAPFEAHRWGIWSVSFLLPMTSRENARRNLEAILPKLKPKWQEWRSRRSQEFKLES